MSFFEKQSEKENISESANLIGEIFNDKDDGIKFLDLVLARFEHFDELNRAEESETFSNDINYILKSSMISLTSENFENRIDSYFYIYHRLEEYFDMKKKSSGSFTSNFEIFREKLYDLLSSTFACSKGAKPNLCTDDSNLLKRMNISQHLSSIKTLDTGTLNRFFALCKLSMQSSLSSSSSDRLYWIDILSKVQDIKLTLQDFIMQYIDYESAFKQFPLDTSTFIYLIQRLPPLKQSSTSPFIIFISLSRKLNLKTEEFFDLFQPIFINGIKDKHYELKHISVLFRIFHTHDYLFDKYLSIYSSNINNDELWNMFLHLCSISEINDIMKKYLIKILTKRICSVSMETFRDYTQSVRECLIEIKRESRVHFIEIFEQIYDVFITTQIQDPKYSSRLTQTDRKELLKIGLELTSTNDIKRPSCLLLLRESLFKIDNRMKNTAEKIKYLFQNFQNFNENLDPIEIIDDDWLKDYLITNCQIWLKLDDEIYQYLCNHHQENRWIIHIWTRIMHLSLLKLINDNPIDILVKLNEWMKNIKHEIYDSQDILTLIFIQNLFEILIIKYTKSILSLPNVEIIFHWIFSMQRNQPDRINTVQVDSFIRNGRDLFQEILQLKGTCLIYRELLNGSILDSFLPFIDLNKILTSVNPQLYKFPSTTSDMDSIIPLQRPNDIDINDIESFSQFIQQINQWLQWFNRFIDIFQPIIEWLKNYNVIRAHQFHNELYTIRNDPKITFIRMKILIEDISKLLQSIPNLHRLCHLFNCLTSFRILDYGTLNTHDNNNKYLDELKRFQPNNTFTIECGGIYKHMFSINTRQQVQWSLASEHHSCDIQMIYQTSDYSNNLLQKENIPIHKHVLYGQFETSQAGQLIIILNNKQPTKSCKIWYRMRLIGLSTCQLFNGIFNLFYEKHFNDKFRIMNEDEFRQLLNQVFAFIDKLLFGNLSLNDMKDLRNIFCDKNIHIQEEVKKLYINHSNEKQIEQVCEWLQIYQYYSHINIIMDCIEKFDILESEKDDEILGDLRRLNSNENCSLREITKAYKILQEKFQNLTHEHLQLIKIVVECANVVRMMKKSDLYSKNGQRRFQELRDNLTTQFQLQERNNMILNSWIMTYGLIEPFIFKAKNFDEFVSRLTQLANFEESSLDHIKTINDNIQIVNMWLSEEETSVLDNALITMEYLYKSGTVNIYLRHLMNEQSYFEISYSIDRIQGQAIDNRREAEKLKSNLSMGDVDDHKRQLTFCNVDVEQNILYKKALINGQLKLLQIVEKIYSNLIKLELSGHPDYQSHEEHYSIDLQFSQNNFILSDFRNQRNIRLENAIKARIDLLQTLAKTLQTRYDVWIKNLKIYRDRCSLLKLFSNRQIMFLIILLRTSTSPDSIRNRFLKNLFSFKDQNNEEDKLSIQCLIHYLRSLRIYPCNLSDDHIFNLYKRYPIDSYSGIDICLEKLSQFLTDLFSNQQELFRTNEENQQYLVKLNPIEQDDFDMNTCCVLLNIFHHQLPASYQILWCSNISDEDIYLFFSRIRTFCSLTFVIMDIDRMHHRLREILLNEQDLLTREQKSHGIVYYFSREFMTSRKGLREYQIPAYYTDLKQTFTQLITLFQKHQSTLPSIQIIYGIAGIGKTHRINTDYKDQILSCFSINDKLNLSLLISSFLLFDSNCINDNPMIYFNISIHAPFEALNRTLFSLFICGSLNDQNSGLTFSLPMIKPWKFVIEIPYSDITHLTIRENFDRILPVLSIISSSNLTEITSENYQLSIGEEEELVARFLKAYENRTIDRLSISFQNGIDEEVKFDPIINPDECRFYIYNCITKYAPELPGNKIYQLSFTKFLYRRVRFFLGYFYRFNQTIKQLGSIAMKQMIDEAKALSQISFQDNHYPRIYLVYDPYFSLHLLHADWNQISNALKSIFDNHDPTSQMKDYFAECLSWLINIRYETFIEVMNEAKFILTENFAYKLFHIHERKLTKLALIIEGNTGVGKTFLLRFYSLLLNSKHRKHSNENNITPEFIRNSSRFLHGIINDMRENQVHVLNIFLEQIKAKLLELNGPRDIELLEEIKFSLMNFKYNKEILYQIWKTILTVSSEHAMNTTSILTQTLHDYITTELANYPLIEASTRLKTLLQELCSPMVDISIEIFKEYLFSSQIKPLFYRLLLHPGITEEQLVQFMSPISQLARELPQIEIVVFFDEVNTSSCLGLFKEMFMDRTLHGRNIPRNIFFTAAINPLLKIEDQERIHRSDYLVHELPQSLKCLKVSYGSLESRTLADYIARKIAMFQLHSSTNEGRIMPLERYFQDKLTNSIVKAQEFCEKYLGQNSVSQREIQRCFNLIEFFWNMRYDDEIENNPKYPIRCIALSIALIYYFRLPTIEDNLQRNDTKTPSREQLARALSQTIPNFEQLIQNELQRFVNNEHFVIPQGVAINQAVREHIFSIVVSIVTRTPLCIIGIPGQSKTLSFQIVLQNLQGSQLSSKQFCKRLPAIDPFFCLGSKYSRSEDIAYIFERAIKREQQYEQNRMNTRCVVFLDEASLPNEKKMILKVLHPYLDECKVAFVAVANKAFDAANANRMICIYRSLPSEDDQKILAYGCLGLQPEQRMIAHQLETIISGLCQGYRRLFHAPDIPHIFHDRDFIYMLRELRFELANTQETNIGEITPRSLLRALEDNFNGIKHDEFEKLIDIFFTAVNEKCPSFQMSSIETMQRNIPTILRESMKLDSNRRRLYGRYKLIIDESEDESAVRLLTQTKIIDSDPTRTNIFRMSDFPDDINNELRNVEILSTIKLCMETGKTILMVNTGRIHGSLYDVFNQNFSIMATDETRKIFSKVAIGPKTIDVVVHEDFQCIVHIKRSEFEYIPPPFLSRFQKYSLSVIDFYHIELEQIPENERNILKNVEKKVQTFIHHFGEEYFYGLNDNTLYSYLLSLIKRNENDEYYLLNPHQNYTQLTIKSKSFIEQNSQDLQQCLLFSIISKLLQLVSPESMIYKLPTFEDKISRLLCENYFYEQEHFNIENFLQRFISSPSIEVNSNDLFTTEDDFQEKLNEISITTKVMMFTRTSSFVIGLNNQTKKDLFNHSSDDMECTNISEKIDVINLSSIENSVQLNEQFRDYEDDVNKKVLMIIIIDTRITQQCLHIPFVRQLIDKTDNICNRQTPRKFFLILLHSFGQEINPKSCFPSIFLDNWDYYYLDTSTPGSSFHLQKILQIFTSSFGRQSQKSFDNSLCDYKTLFDDCLWDFCSRLQIFVHKLPKEMFKNSYAYEFYQPQTRTIRRVHCLKELLRQSTQFQERIVTNYHENISINRELLQKTCHLNYQISKDILCGKRLTSLVDSFQSDIRISFTNFVSNFLKFIVNAYGLETLAKLSSKQYGYDSLLNLIDYSSFSTNDQTIHNNFSLRINYFFIPQTPLYNLFHERIKSIADGIKSLIIEKQNSYSPELPITTFDNDELIDNSSEQFRNEFIRSLMQDKILTKIISRPILESYTNDSVRRLCTTIETNFHQKAVDFISNWLLSIDENNKESFDLSSNRDIWLLAHVYTSIEYDQNDIFSLYSACRILECLDQTESFYTEQIISSNIRENIFRLMFDHLWRKLVHLCSTNDNIEQWIHSYTFISKYYPSDKVLQRQQLIQVKGQIEFMNLAYLILLNEKTSEPKQLILQLLHDTSLIRDDRRIMNYETSVCLQFLPIIIKTIHQYANNSTVMIDIQQWIIYIIKSSNQSCRQEVLYLFKFLNQSTCQLTLSMKQFLFDQLANLYIQSKQQCRIGLNRQKSDFWDRISLLPIIIECLSNGNLENYQIPYHPSVISNTNQNQTLIDLYFFHLQRLINDEIIKSDLINKILLSKSPPINNRNLIPMAEIIFKKFKDYFILQTTALLLCQSDLRNQDQQRLDRILTTIINQYLRIDRQPIQLTKYLKLFFSIIIAKRSWTFLLNLLKSERFQRVNAQWSNSLYNLFEFKRNSQSLQLCHQLQFTIIMDTTLSIFPKFHQPYEELSKLIDQCVKHHDHQQRWKPFIEWIQLKLNSNPPVLNSTEIKVMLLLNIYYNYYCNNQLSSLDNLLSVIEKTLQPLSEELRVFQAFLQPEQYMIGYPIEDDNEDKNEVNNLFRVDCKDNEELSIRHSLVNLLAMILLSGKQNFLWTFTFEPSELQNTFGFGSARHEVIQRNGVHYDCGCILTQNGDLEPFFKGNLEGSVLNIPTVYIALFSTFGALTWHLLLFDTSVENLYGSILTKTAVDDTTVTYRIVGKSIRAKVCHFVRARLLSTYHFLSIHFNEDDACILLNRCFEQLAQLTHPRNSWIKSIYTNFDEKIQVEQEFQDQIFYPIYQQLGEYKQLINNLYLQSSRQTPLQDYISQMPILIQFKDFKTELSNPKNAHLSLNILRYILQSFDFLKMTYFIYDLSQFYLLLHRTYAQLIERNELFTMTLKQLYERNENQSKNSYQNNKHISIIENGIKAVNTYHKFSNGRIQPGACDETQRFITISIDTSISYLITTDNHDEGDIIMRILSTLIDYHNQILDIMEENIDNNGIGLLRNLINELTSKEISILQIAQDNTGVIKLNDNDCLWIEQLSRASLETEEYFLRLDTPKNFDFLYVQSYIIRSYLLFCRINYRHIFQKYQFFIPRKIGNHTTEGIPNPDIDDEWNHIKKLNLDKLNNGHNLLRRIIDLLKSSEGDDLSKLNLYEYLQKIDDQKDFLQQCEQNQIKDFPLEHIHHIYQLYEQTINHFQHCFINVSHLLHVPIERNFDPVFNLSDDDQQDKEKLQFSIKNITEFLNDLKDAEESLLNHSSQSLKQICQDLRIKNPILEYIPAGIKCQNYVPLGIKLIEIRSKLQEKIILFKEENTQLWDANFDIPFSEEQNVFQRFKNPNIDPLLPFIEPIPNTLREDHKDVDILLIDFDNFPTDPPVSLPNRNFLEKLDYTPLFQLKIKSVPFVPSLLFNTIQKQTELPLTSTKAFDYTIIYADGTSNKHLCRTENLYEQLKKNFHAKNYNYNQLVIIDQDNFYVDFINENNGTSGAYLSKEYRIIEKNLLMSVILEFQEQQWKYLVTKETRISSIINRFILDRKFQLTSNESVLGFFDEFGKYIEEDNSIDKIHRLNNTNIIQIKILQYANETSKLSQITLCSKEGEQEIKYFDLLTKWEQIGLWLKTSNIPIDTCHFWNREYRYILDKHQSISFTLDDSISINIDGINDEDIMEIILSYDKNEQKIRILKSCPASYLLNNSHYLNLKNSPMDYILVLIKERDERILSTEDLKQPISHYSTIENEILHFQISILIQLIQFDNQEEFQIPISNQNLPIKKCLQFDNIYSCLASIDTHMIISNNKKFSDINQRKFYLVKDSQICSISIEQTNDQIIVQQYTIEATMADIYQENISSIQDQYLLYENDFIPSLEIALTSFLPTEFPIQFKLINRKFQANVTVINEEEQTSIQFYCLPSIFIERICQIACRLFHLNPRFYRLTLVDHTTIEDDYSLDEIGESMDNIQLLLKSTADVKCQVIYEDKTILIPANNETLGSSILKEALNKLLIFTEDFRMYQLYIMDDPVKPSNIGLDLSIEEIRSCFIEDLVMIPFQLQKK